MSAASIFTTSFRGLSSRGGPTPAQAPLEGVSPRPVVAGSAASIELITPPEPAIESLGIELEIPLSTLEGFAAALGAGISTKVVRIAYIPEADVLEAVNTFKLGEVTAGALAKGDAMRLFRAAQALAVGAGHALTSEAVAKASEIEKPAPTPKTQEVPGRNNLRFSDYIDYIDEGIFQSLTPEECHIFRDFFSHNDGCTCAAVGNTIRRTARGIESTRRVGPRPLR